MTPREIRADDVGSAWVKAVRHVLEQYGGEAFHLAVRIGAKEDDPNLRKATSDLGVSQGMQPVDTVANTIFPASMAATTSTMDELAARYQSLYPRIRKYSLNHGGTYFGRLVAHPAGGKYANQLSNTIRKLRFELENSHHTSRYECAVYDPATDAGKLMSFPCLSSIAFHLDVASRLLHTCAIYRNQRLVERGYGNYLGLAQLRNRIAHEVGLEAGELLVIAGHAEVDGRRRPLKALLDQFESE